MSSDGVTVRQWTDVVRRARLGRTVKAVAVMLATYADADGTRVFPGVARLAVACEIDQRTIKRALGTLRGVGLIDRVKVARHRGMADEYRLILHPDLLDRVEVLSPAQVTARAEAIRDANRRRTDRPDPGPGTGNGGTRTTDAVQGTPVPVQAVDNDAVRGTGVPVHATVDEDRTGNGDAPTDGCTGNGVTAVRGTPATPPPMYLDTSTTSHTQVDLCTEAQPLAREASTGDFDEGEVGAPAPPESPPPPPVEQCGHGFPVKFRPDGQRTCALCRRGLPGTPRLRLVG